MIVVTGATGHLGRLVVEDLLERGVPAGEIIAAARTPEKAADLAARGVQVREADYDRPETLATAFTGATKVLLISSEPGNRVAQHRAVIDAATAAGVGLLAYTSILRADTNEMVLAADHQATEAAIVASGLPYVLLRNSWYLEVYTARTAQLVADGAIYGAAGDGRISGAARADYAAAAAAVLTSDGPVNVAYELGGDTAFTLTELAAEITERSGRPVAYRDLPVEELEKSMVGAGLPAGVAALFADVDANIARGALHTDSGDLSRLTGRPTTPLSDAVAAALKA
ncbi:NAD(P)H dehydrogenase (quinone) [Catenuloplanes nepalensis]|uniref:NAD(P)H dehydrogenase (Quinone) n=1 Tax=Catenuloplanes nepalensis TaxID=587533 RepID=A0ABT9MYL0_9ACTN|nr:SDR family oxidoreductase [Catenuloplanes nepalensis]MDP9796529.1 NAD(P)H dehydrogenase (quinone) [Catenuloplanes nepalensis]